MEKISGIILTNNNERNIADCIKSIKDLVQELIIIDDYSTDKTIEIILAIYPDAKIIHNKLVRFDEQRNIGIKKSANEWILMIDSDERITPELAQSIKITKIKEKIIAYWVIRMNRTFHVYLPENHIHRPILFKRELQFVYPVHEIIKLDKNKKQKLKGKLIHENWISLENTIAKTNQYSALTCQRWLEEKRNYSKLKIAFLICALPAYSFLHCLIIKKYYRLGFIKGVAYSIFEAGSWINTLLIYHEARYKN